MAGMTPDQTRPFTPDAEDTADIFDVFDAAASIVGAMSETPESVAASKDEDCATCLSGRAITLAVVFGLFAAYCAADFATGGRLTTYLAGLVASVRGGTGER